MMSMEANKQSLHLISDEDVRLNPEKFFTADECGFFICMAGCATVSFFNKIYEVKQGSLALFHPFVKIIFRDVSNDLKGYWGEIDIFKALPVVNQVLNVESIEAIKGEPVVHLQGNMFSDLIRKVEEFLKQQRELKQEIATSEICRPICKALLKSANDTMLLDVLNRYYLTKSKTITPTTEHDIVFQKFMMDLQQNYMTHHDTQYYARRSSLSPKYFSTVIRQVSGAAPMEWIIQTIISVAQNYLTDTSMTIKEISSTLGFPSQAFFCKYFKRYTSYAPTEYRIRHK